MSDLLWLPRFKTGWILFYNKDVGGLGNIRNTLLSLIVPALRALKPSISAPPKNK